MTHGIESFYAAINDLPSEEITLDVIVRSASLPALSFRTSFLERRDSAGRRAFSKLTQTSKTSMYKAGATMRSSLAFATLLLISGSASRLPAQGCIGDVNQPSTFFAPPNIFPAGTRPRSVTVGDFNHDGKADVAVANEGSNNVSILLGNGAGALGSPTDFNVGLTPEAVLAADVNEDHILDLIIANYGSNNVSVLIGTGSGSFSAAQNSPVGSSPQALAVADFNSDGHLDIAVANSASNNVSILFGIGTGSFGAPLNFAVGTSPWSLAAGDFNADGRPDLAVANAGTNIISILLGSVSGFFSSPANYPVANAFSIATGDINGDGVADLATANLFSDNVSVLFGTGNGTFTFAFNLRMVPFGFSGPLAVVQDDVNNDGLGDIAVVDNALSAVSIVFGGIGGSVSIPPARFSTGPVGSGPVAIAVGDFNGDGRKDLVVANNEANNVAILLNTCAPIILPIPTLSDYMFVALFLALLFVAWSHFARYTISPPTTV
jgi:hypothetical protein